MRLLQIAEFAVLSLSLSFAPPADNPKKSVRFPDVAPAPLPPSPAPKPGPDAQIALNEGELYVVEGDPFEIRAYPPGIVSVAKSGPGRVFGKFVGGSGKYEWKEFTAPCVAIVQATANGSVTLVVRPGDAKSEADWIDRSIRSNVGPQPPPKPDPEPIPPPKPKPEPVTSFRVIWVHESSQTNTPATVVMNAKTVRDYLNANCTKDENWPGWREWDKDQKVESDYQAFKDLWAEVNPKLTAIPAVVIQVNGKASIEPFPKTPADAVALFKKFNGGQ